MEQEPDQEIEYGNLCDLVSKCGIKANRNNLCLFLKPEIDSGIIVKSKIWRNNTYIHTWKLNT